MATDYTKDGYRIVPARETLPEKEKGIQCGLCGMRFEDGKTYMFSCGNSRCPVQTNPTF